MVGRIFARNLPWLVLPLLLSCSGATNSPVPGRGAPPPAAPAPVATPPSSPFPTQTGDVDDWSTFAHDSARTGFEAQNTGITTATVSRLTLRWTYRYGEALDASPLVSNGLVYLAGESGTVRALSVADGSVVWQVSLGAPVRMTPALDSGLLFVGTHGQPGMLVALDATTGAIRWTATLPGAIRAEPVVLQGTVYVGDASGDPPVCNQGGLHGFTELTGSHVLTWFDDPKPADGGAVWSPISTDGDALYFGTGNTCSPGVTYANAAVKLSPAGDLQWGHNSANALSDDDFGGGLTILGSEAIGIDKNGMLYAFDRASGTIVWSDKLGVLDGYGGMATPGTDGRTIVVGGGYVTDPTKTAGNPGGLLYGIARDGKISWKVQLESAITGSIAVVPGVAFVSMNGGLSAISLASGATLWSHAFGATAYASPAVVPSGVYVADEAGTVYAFALPASPSGARRMPHPGRR